MQQTFSSKLTQIAIATASAALLAACGGGGDSNDDYKQPGGTTPSNLSLSDQKQGLISKQDSYALALAIGDTWLLALDPASLSYTLTVIQTSGVDRLQPGSQHSGTYTNTSGELRDAAGGWTLKINPETQTITGQFSRFGSQLITLSGQSVTPQASGSIYKAPEDLSRFKGTYFVSGAMRNANNSRYRAGYAGQMRISDDGKSATLCANGLFNDAGKCAAVDSGEQAEMGTFSLATDAKTGLISVSNTAGSQGLLSFQLSPLGGYTIVHDRLGKNEEGVLRTGTMYGSQIPELKAGDLDGKFNCKNAYSSTSVGTLTLNGSSATISSSDYSATENLSFNQMVNSAGKLIKIAGIAESTPKGSPNEGAIIHPISKDQLLVEDFHQNNVEGYAFNICTRI